MKAQKSCELCKESATCVCFNCSFYLCDSCFDYIHENEENSGHEKEKIDTIIPINIKCSKHPKIPISLFCVEEKSK